MISCHNMAENLMCHLTAPEAVKLKHCLTLHGEIPSSAVACRKILKSPLPHSSLSHSGSEPPSNTWLLGSTGVQNLIGISIGSVVFAGLMDMKPAGEFSLVMIGAKFSFKSDMTLSQW